MEENQVALVACDSYERELIEHSVQRVLDLLGGPQEIVGKGRSVFLKVNALSASDPSRMVSTHPEVVRALILELKKMTSRITIGDSPGGLYNRTLLRRVYDRCGFAQVAEETGVALNYNTSVTLRKLAAAETIKSITLAGAMVEADHLISISKFKTHNLVNITAAIKNLFGTVPGMTKFIYHSRFADVRAFSNLLVDVFLAAEPDFHLIDAVVGMDGNGPASGDKKELGFLAAARDAFALESVMMDLIGIAPEKNRALEAAMARGLCPHDSADVVVRGDDIESLRVNDFRLPTKKNASEYVPHVLMERFGHHFSVRPYPDPARCTGCRKCADICPEGAISMENKVAVVDQKRCIRCYCCDELCEYDAIDLRRPLLMRIAGMAGG